MAGSDVKEERTIRPDGNLGIDRAALLRAEILDALASSRRVILDLEAVSDIDLSCLQVLYAARKSARTTSREFSIRGSLPPRTLDRLFASGFLNARPGAGGTASAPSDLGALLLDF